MTYNKETQYLIFKEVSTTNRKTPMVEVLNKGGEHLGIIRFYPQWRKFVFEAEHCIFDALCLNDLIEVLDEQQKQWREKVNSK